MDLDPPAEQKTAATTCTARRLGCRSVRKIGLSRGETRVGRRHDNRSMSMSSVARLLGGVVSRTIVAKV